MRLDEIEDEIAARIGVLSKLRQPGPVDLGDAQDNETVQDDLFQELDILEYLESYIECHR